MHDEKAFQQLSQRIEALVNRFETATDPQVRADALELVQALMDLHGAGLDRLMEIVAGAGAPGEALMEDFARDELVVGLLLLYGLHPHDLETRVRLALERVQPYLHSHGGNVELLHVNDGIVRLRLVGSCQTCPSSTLTLKTAIERAIYEAAPDVVEIISEGGAAEAPANGFVQLTGLAGRNGYTQCVSIEAPGTGLS